MSDDMGAVTVKSDDNRLVTLRVEVGDNLAEIYMSGSDARQLAKTLTYAALEADLGHDREIRLGLDTR